jgi:catechol 2,3-dioxygenase-like lactoylglutathione lyase family enzyme
MNDAPTLRVARPTDNLDALIPFYRDGLGFEIICRFDGHDGIDGLMFGRRGAPYHFEFTHTRGHRVGRAPTEDNLIVFYLPDDDAWITAVARMRSSGFEPVASLNPYWDRHGATFEDPDGYRVVLQNASWPI